jgi:hypothetical protein
MSEKVIFNLLTNNAPLNAIVPASRIKEMIPLGAALPSIAYSHVSTTQETGISLITLKSRTRVQVTVAAKTYPECFNIAKLVKTACNNKQGTFAGIKTNSVILDVAGSDFRDDDAVIYFKTIDFIVTYDE